MNRRRAARLTMAAGLLLALAGCGGRGGGGGSTVTSESTARDNCSLTMFTPNYASGITLSYWPQFPIHVYFDTASASYTPDLQARAVTAFNGWVTQTNGQVAYSVVTDLNQADVVVGFVPLTDTALSSYDADGITYFNSTSTASGTADSDYGSVRLYIGINGQTTRENGTMGHEFGHALGIHGHSPDSNDIMYYEYTRNRSPIPTTRDVNTLETAYCGIFSRAETIESISGRSETPRRRVPIPPLSAPGWTAIP